MGCITATGYRLGQSIAASGHKAFPSVVVSGRSIYSLGQSLEMSGYKVGPSVAASGFSRYTPLQVSGVAVCPLTTAPYIGITPQVIWLTEANNFMGRIEVDSNTNWRIEIKE